MVTSMVTAPLSSTTEELPAPPLCATAALFPTDTSRGRFDPGVSAAAAPPAELFWWCLCLDNTAAAMATSRPGWLILLGQATPPLPGGTTVRSTMNAIGAVVTKGIVDTAVRSSSR